MICPHCGKEFEPGTRTGDLKRAEEFMAGRLWKGERIQTKLHDYQAEDNPPKEFE